mmetsp:Transcript_34325/g.80216  ORF Transcript_34325/g.80216 Transcript_34325/m.80216 type:complete len:154 (+) Transcript_34325:1138-1599(+)
MFRPSEHVLCYLAASRGVGVRTKAGAAPVLTGVVSVEHLEQDLNELIQTLQLCSACASPETLCTVRGRKHDRVLHLDCAACGHSGAPRTTGGRLMDKMVAAVQRTPMSRDLLPVVLDKPSNAPPHDSAPSPSMLGACGEAAPLRNVPQGWDDW